jgi:hypothetical protein
MQQFHLEKRRKDERGKPQRESASALFGVPRLGAEITIYEPTIMRPIFIRSPGFFVL